MQLHNGLVEVNVSVKAARLGWGQEQTPIPGDLGHPLQADSRSSKVNCNCPLLVESGL